MHLRYFLIWSFLLLAWIVNAGPDDDYIAVYRALSSADTEQLQGHTTLARRQFQEARERLLALHKAYPSWNEKVVGFRLRYIDEKLTELGPETAGSGVTTPETTSPANIQRPALAPEGEVLDQFNRLNQQIGELTRDRQALEAKLREALSAQPAPVDPRDLQQAVEKISALQATNQVLSAQLERQVSERKNLVEKVVADEAREALNEANRQLLSQRILMANLEKERTGLDAELKSLKEGELKGLKSENTSLKAQVTELKTETERGRQIAELTGKLSALQDKFDAAQKENSDLLSDRARLEKQIEDYRSHQTEESSLRIRKLETDLAVAKADASRNSARVEQLTVEIQKESSKAGILQQDNQALTARVAALTTQLANAQKAEIALAAEQLQRKELEAQLKSAEQRLQAAAVPDGRGATDDGAPDPGNPSAGSTFQNSQVSILSAEVARLRSSLQEGHDRELRLQTLLAEVDRQRQQWTTEKADLLARIHQLERSSGRENGASGTPAGYQKLDARVRELEKQREELTQKLAEAAVRVDTEGGVIREANPVTPREKAVEFRLRRGP